MAFNHPNPSFWDFVREYDNNNNNGAGVDRPELPTYFASFGGGPGPVPHGPHGPHGAHPHHHPPPPRPPGAFPSQGGFPFGGPFGGFGGRRGRRCGGGRGGSRGHEGPEHHGHRHHRGGPAGEHQEGGPFDLNALLSSLAGHPLAQAFRTYADQFAAQQTGEAAADANEEENTFTPPIDVFSTETHFILHVALPGAKKEDVGINWDAEKGVLNLAGVVYRQGDEEFLKSLTQSERKVGVFERAVRLPPAGNEKDEKEEVDGDAISAKLEDGVLVVKVPKVEKEWTDVKKVDIE